MNKFIYFLFFFISFASLQGGNIARMLQDLDVIKSTFETKYAPYEWKKSYFGWSLEEEIQIAKIKIISLNSLTVKDYQRILHTFFTSMRDFHVQEFYYSTEISLLPFSVASINGTYYITNVNIRALQALQEKGLYTGKKLLEIGNEILLFDSTPIADIVEDLKFQEFGNSTSKTSQVLAEKILTSRFGTIGHKIPQGNVLISFKTNDDEIVDAAIEWTHIPEEIKNQSYTAAMAAFGKFTAIETPEKTTSKYSCKSKTNQMINPLAEILQKDYSVQLLKQIKSNKLNSDNSEDRFPSIIQEEEEEFSDEGDYPSNIIHSRAISRENIAFGEKIWSQSERNPFRAHLYKLPGTDKKIGYIRISTYSETDDEFNDFKGTRLILQLAQALKHLEIESDALIVDQVDNPGGNLLYALAITSLLSNQPLQLLNNQIALTQNEVAQAVDNIPELEEGLMEFEELEHEFFRSLIPFKIDNFYSGFPLDKNFIISQLNFSYFILNEWEQGKTLSSRFPISGIDVLNPHPLSHYSKPILFLINSTAFSCADVVPAILQDNQRAVIFGEQTAGAGGAVEVHSYPNSFGLKKFTYTVSLLERLNGLVIENLGVTPDVPYQLTKEDLFKGYKGYAEAVNETLKQMLKD